MIDQALGVAARIRQMERCPERPGYETAVSQVRK